MKKKELTRRYAFFILAVLVNAFSIAVITKALLGTSPISSVPYVLSLATPPTMGQYTIYMNLLFIVFEMLIIGWRETCRRRYELLAQVPVTLIFGFFIDVSMQWLLPWLDPQLYILKIATLLVGCCILGLGVSMEVKADVAMVTGEYLVNVISKAIRRDFGLTKVCFDVSLVILACVLSLLFLGRIEGVREGTVAAALLVGPISHIIYPHLHIFDKLLLIGHADDKTTKAQHRHVVITIAREHGSDGHRLGEMLAQRLGIAFYDKALIAMAAEDSSMSEQYIEDNEQRMSANALLNIVLRDYGAPIDRSLTPADAVFVAQSRVIRRIAGKQPCIILGRLADRVLGDYPPAAIIRVFCHADTSKRQQSDVEAERINRSRAAHYQYYTGCKWGDPHNYDLTLNIGSIGLETACNIVAQLYETKNKNLDYER